MLINLLPSPIKNFILYERTTKMTKRHNNILYAVILGCKGYFNDRKHDKALKILSRYYCRIEAKDNFYDDWLPLFDWKEGSLWYYIRQVRYGQYISQKRQKQDETDKILSKKRGRK